MEFPRRSTTGEKLELVSSITQRLKSLYGDDLVAVGVYGSVARGDSGPYSDIEMYAVLDEEQDRESYEFVYQGFKVEIDLVTAEGLLADAANIDENWAITVGAFLDVLAIDDPKGFFPLLRQAAEKAQEQDFSQVIYQFVVDNLYEWVGKLRNAWEQGNLTFIPTLIIEIFWDTLKLVGLVNKVYYKRRSEAIETSLRLPLLPSGYRELAEYIMIGYLSDHAVSVQLGESLWQGTTRLMESQGVDYLSKDLPIPDTL